MLLRDHEVIQDQVASTQQVGTGSAVATATYMSVVCLSEVFFSFHLSDKNGLLVPSFHFPS